MSKQNYLNTYLIKAAAMPSQGLPGRDIHNQTPTTRESPRQWPEQVGMHFRGGMVFLLVAVEG